MTDHYSTDPTDPTDHVDLPGLLRGELDNATVSDTRAHLETCAECRTSLVEVAAGHSMLLRAARSQGPVRRAPALAHAPAPADLPPPPTPRRTARHPVPLLVAALVVAATLVVGLLRPWSTEEPAPPAATGRSATLEPLAGDGGGSVSLTVSGRATRMVIETHDLPALDAGQFYYAWLLDPATDKMLPLGQVGAGAGGRSSFDLPAGLLEAYSAIDVSLEDDDGDPQHSPTSVLRATYA